MKKLTKISIGVVLLALYLMSMIAVASALVVKDVSTDPSEIAPGDTSIIEVTLENDGSNDITDVSVVLDFKDVPFAPYSSSSEDSIDEIQEDDEETARFRIIALSNANSGIYKIPMSITYTEDEVVKIKNSLISLTINSEPVLGVEAEEGLLLKGTKNELKVKIVNKGLSDIRFLEVSLGVSSYVDILSQNNVYIGDVNSDDFDSADFEVFFNKDTPENFQLPIILTYKDSTNQEFVEAYNLDLKVYSQERAIELGLMQKSRTALYIGIGVVVVILFFGYRYLRKRKRLKKANNGGGF